MRALVLIICCIFVLVIVQASYLVIEAKRPDGTKTRVAAGTDSTEHAHKKHHHDDSSAADRTDEHSKQKFHKALKHSHHHGNPLVPPGEQQIKESSEAASNVTYNHSENSNDDKDIYQQMLGDAPIGESREHGHRKDDRKRPNGTKHHKKGKKLHKNKGKKNQAHDNAAESCEHDADCGDGKCCVNTNKGLQVCKPGAYKGLGKRCLTSCVCQEGLQCFINKSHKLKKKKKKKTTFRRGFGHCVDPVKARMKSGYVLTDTLVTNSTTTPAPSTATQDIP